MSRYTADILCEIREQNEQVRIEGEPLKSISQRIGEEVEDEIFLQQQVKDIEYFKKICPEEFPWIV